MTLTMTQIRRRLQLSLVMYVSFWLYMEFATPISVVGLYGWTLATAVILWGSLSFVQVCFFGVLLYRANNSLS